MPALLSRSAPTLCSSVCFDSDHCRTLDPFLGIFTGVFAYYLAENHPRTGFTPEERLRPLVQWKWAQYKSKRDKQLEGLEPNIDWTGLSPEEGKE